VGIVVVEVYAAADDDDDGFGIVCLVIEPTLPSMIRQPLQYDCFSDIGHDLSSTDPVDRVMFLSIHPSIKSIPPIPCLLRYRTVKRVVLIHRINV
jgi:hypothetical protein